MEPQFSISALAQEFDVTPRTLRFYEEKGLLSPRREGQNRIYSAADRTRLKLVLRGKRLGLSLEDSAKIIALYDPKTHNRRQLELMLTTIVERRLQLRAQQEDIEAMLAELEAVEERTRLALAQSIENTSA